MKIKATHISHISGKARPKNLNLRTIRLPLPALVSILHRLSGVFLFLLLPFMLWLFEHSLVSVNDFEHIKEVANQPFVKVLLLILFWAFLHHSLAGLRLLILDMRSEITISNGRWSSKLVLFCSVFLTLSMVAGF